MTSPGRREPMSTEERWYSPTSHESRGRVGRKLYEETIAIAPLDLYLRLQTIGDSVSDKACGLILVSTRPDDC